MENSVEILEDQHDYLKPGWFQNKVPVYRLTHENDRFYYSFFDGKPEIYSSGTTVISDGYVQKKEDIKRLWEWRMSMISKGINPDEYVRHRANYGTVMHLLFGRMLSKEVIPLGNKKLKEFVRQLPLKLNSPSIEKVLTQNLDELRKDLISFKRWIEYYNIEPVAIELMLQSRKWVVATAIDLICYADIEVEGYWGETYASGKNKGQPKLTKKKVRKLIIVDFKSGKKGFDNKYALQLGTNKLMIEEAFPRVKIDGIFNYAGKNWRKAGDTNMFSFKNQTENPVLTELVDVLTMGSKRHVKKPKFITIFEGSLEFGAPLNFENLYKKIPLVDYLKDWNFQKNSWMFRTIENHKITSKNELKDILQGKTLPFLRNLAKDMEITWKNKKDFITLVLQKSNL